MRKASDNQSFLPNDRIDHLRFGLGTILTIDDGYTTIEFDETGTRRFVTGMLKLVPSVIEKPPRHRRVAKKVHRPV